MASEKFADTMIGSKDLGKNSEFYKQFLGIEVSNPCDGKTFMFLKDPKTNQTLCITADPTIQIAIPSIETENMDLTVHEICSLGGMVLSHNTFASMQVANVEDFEGRKTCIWQTI